MAAEMQAEKPLDELIQNLKVDSSSKLTDANTTTAKDGNPSDATSCISSSGDATSSIKESDMDQESFTTEHGFYYPASNYYGYYYPGYDGSFGEWDDQGYFLGGDGLEIQYPAIQADNGSLIYCMPGYNYNQPGYNPYNPYLPGALIGVDGQYLGQQSYYPTTMYQQPVASPGYFPPAVPYGPEILQGYPWGSSPFFGDGLHGNGYGGGPTVLAPKPNLSTPSPTTAPHSKSTPTTKSSTPLETTGSTPAPDVPPSSGNISVTGALNHSLKPPVNKVQQHGSGFQSTAVLAKGYFPVVKFPLCPNQGKGGLLYPNNPLNYKGNGRSWGGTDKLKTRAKANGVADLDLLNEQNRGPRTNNARNTWLTGVDAVGSMGAVDSDNGDNSAFVIRRDLYNLPDFPTKYDHALFFVIKSYSEDDIHKSIKYNVWASTPNGNRRLDSAYQDAQAHMVGKGGKCPVFLFFSVNASGQFCGVAEMIGEVDFNKSMDFWQQDKWSGYFPVKWHIIKDIPNPQFRHIILENNDNKPVTNSRDTQEVKFPQGIEMLGIFKNYAAKTSILDDFGFYETRQKVMLDKRTRPPTPRLEHGQLEASETTKGIVLGPVVAVVKSTEMAVVKNRNEELPVKLIADE